MEELASKIAFGEEGAFKAIYKSQAPALKFFAFNYLENEDAIDDILQDTFVALWNNRESFDNERAIKAFLYKAVKNASLNYIRHSSVKDKYAKAVLEEDNSESFLDKILEAETFRLLLSLFEELPPACREVYRKSLNGMSHSQIAQELGISVNTVKRHKNKANHFLKERLKNILSLILYMSI